MKKYKDPKRRQYYVNSWRRKVRCFPPCTDGRHSKCARTVELAGHVSMKCNCSCHLIPEAPRPKTDNEAPGEFYPLRLPALGAYDYD